MRDSAKAADAQMNRLYVVECGFSITGSMADHRRAVKPSEIAGVVGALAGKLGVGAAPAGGVRAELADFIDKLAADIYPAGKAGEKTIFVAGSRQPAEVHAAVAAINGRLAGPVDYYAEPEDPRGETGWTAHGEQLAAFADAAKSAGAVLVIGCNPVLTAPAALHVGDVLGKVPSIHLGTHEDETAQACGWHIPQSHYLEAWGDVRTFDGAVSVAQPLIEPIFGGRSAIEVLSLLLGSKQDGADIVPATAKADYLQGRFTDWAWKETLFNGLVADSARRPEPAVAGADKGAAAVAALGNVARPAAAGEYEISLFAGAAFDGRYANNGWLLELPDPMTRVSWENPLIMSPKTAGALGYQSDDVALVRTPGNGTGVEMVVYVLPGHPDDAMSIAVGFGRTNFGSIADETGSDAYALRGEKDGMILSG